MGIFQKYPVIEERDYNINNKTNYTPDYLPLPFIAPIVGLS
jgi:hypothetical protein